MDGYSDDGLVYNLETRHWTTKSYFTPEGGRRIDHACGTVRERF